MTGVQTCALPISGGAAVALAGDLGAGRVLGIDVDARTLERAAETVAAAGLADRICVMYAGVIVETGATSDVLDRSMHPYTKGLIESVPSRNRRGQPLAQIPGMTPSLLNLPPGCSFHPRCPRADEVCLAEPAIAEPAGTGHSVRCFYPHLEQG